MAFATAEDLRLKLRLATIDKAQAEALLELVSEGIRADVGQHIEAVTGDEVTLDGRGGTVLLLPELPVRAVTSVTENDVQLAEGDNYTWSTTGVLARIGGEWPLRSRSVEVVYDHGYDTPPGAVKTVCVQAAARAWVNPARLERESTGRWSATFGTPDLSAYERSLLDFLRP